MIDVMIWILLPLYSQKIGDEEGTADDYNEDNDNDIVFKG